MKINFTGEFSVIACAMNVSMSLEQARRGLTRHYFSLRNAASRAGTLSQAVRESGYIQIDSIYRIERAHHHSLWNRVQGYRQEQLDEALEEGHILEYWAHAAAYLPMEDFRYCLPRMERIRAEGHQWFGLQDRRLMDHILDRIREEGPLGSADFEDPEQKSRGWYDWKPAKRALEQLFMEGRILVRRRKGFRKLFDLAERVIPGDIDLSMPTEQELARYLIRLAFLSTPLSRFPWLKSQRKNLGPGLEQALQEGLEQGLYRQLEIGDRGTWYCTREFLEDGKPEPKDEPAGVRILSPFDNFVIQRGWLKELFDFDYQLECYLPPEKRRFGYLSLPLMNREGMFGLADCRADRKGALLRVERLWLRGAGDTSGDNGLEHHRRQDPLPPGLEEELSAFARFNGCNEWVFDYPD